MSGPGEKCEGAGRSMRTGLSCANEETHRPIERRFPVSGRRETVVNADTLNVRSNPAPPPAQEVHVGMKAPVKGKSPAHRGAVCLCVQNKNRRYVRTGFLQFIV